jgi:hypothetical protein
VLGGEPNALAQPHHIFDFVLSWTWVSRPMTASYSINAGEFLPRMGKDEHGFFAKLQKGAFPGQSE